MLDLQGALSPVETVYTSSERDAVIALVVGGVVSLVAVFSLFAIVAFSSGKKYTNTHFQVYFVCLLLANVMQAWGNIISLKWIGRGGVIDDSLCAMQGGLKQGGNIGTAVWSFVISFHLFNLLFLRFRTSNLVSWGIVTFGWSFVFMLVFLGPVFVQTAARGHYFGIEGIDCSVTHNYRKEQLLLEYLLEYLSVVLSFFLHTATLLRVRGNLTRVDGRFRLRFVPLGDSWQLALGRDFTDSTMLRLAQRMILYPIAYTVAIIPVSVTRLTMLCDMHVPLGARTFTELIFNLLGLVNVILFFATRRLFPDPGSIPEFEAQRGRDSDKIVAAHGVTPFTLQRTTTSESDGASSHSYPERTSSRRRVSTATFPSGGPWTPPKPTPF
ncbi:hypothetical protein C8J57DRAFT_1714784 [Mycena rebaudengoi]|nr:hypothetical protein C8J57DRAFT_1714784 [Mycena rebaudengoi]